ncbi:MAG: cysteine desulfurase NifS [Parcubacteria group bacterium]|nr:cysteine desulfurase NifS [Parcubacteria group bacterium]
MSRQDAPPIYLDHAATTPVDPEVFATMKPYFTEHYGNPASIHTVGQKAIIAVDEAREQVADFLGCKTGEIIFTSGATESNNFVLKGVLAAAKIQKPHIITSTIEHPCILDTCQHLEKRGVEVTYLPVDKEGVLNTKSVQEAIKENTVLVTIIYANNEIGTIQPIAEIGEIIKKANQERKNKIIFHTDAVQAIQYLDCNVKKLGVDLLSLSGHKFYGPKGVGVLFVKEGTLIEKIQHGGHQEYNKRAGTLNVPGIVGLGKATELTSKNRVADSKKQQKLRDLLINSILKNIPDSHLNGSNKHRLPNNANIRFDKIEGESIMLHLDFEGIAVSTGSACTSGTLEPSHVLLAIGVAKEQAHGSIRFTLGKDTSEADIKKVLEVLPPIVKKLRQMSPLK